MDGSFVMRYFLRAWGLAGLLAGSVCNAQAAEPVIDLSTAWNPCDTAVCAAPSDAQLQALTHDEPLQLVSFQENPITDDAELCYTECAHHDADEAPKWYASIGAIYLNRSRPNPAPIITPPTGTPGVVISASDYDFSFDMGPEVILARRTPRGRIVEARYFTNTEGTAAASIPQITTFRFAGIGVTILGGGSIQTFYTSELVNFELNVYQPISDRCSILAGFRHVELEENLRLNIATPTTFGNFNTLNQLNGAQMGLNFNFTEPGNRLQFRALAKAGVYMNEAEARFTSNIVGSDSESGTDTSFIGEVNFTASYQLTKHWGLRGGYMVMWIQEVTTPGDQAAATVQAPGGTNSPLLTDTDLFYHGVSMSVECVW